MVKQVKKRDGRIVAFDQEKIAEAIWKAAQSVGGKDRELAEKIANQVTTVLEVFFKKENEVPSVEQIQDLVEKILIENGHAKTAKAYILYREKHKQLREEKAQILGMESDTKFSLNALKVLEERYLLKDENGKTVETPEQMIRRVAKNIAQADKKYKDDHKKSGEQFYSMMISKDFMPNSPTLMNAGAPLQQLAACFVLPVEDSIPDIFETAKVTAIIQQTGGGTGFNFSKLRAKGDRVQATNGTSSGPVSFIKVFDSLTAAMKEGGKRRGANMGILNVDHPDILEFITAKEREGEIANFNLSVGLTEKFMNAVEEDQDYDLISPRTGKPVNRLNARSVFELICTRAWSNGEPGIVFLDRLEELNPTPKAGKLVATNPCGEQPLLAYEACNLGSINVANFVKNGDVDFERLKEVVHAAVHFLDNVIDMSDYKMPEIKKVVEANRKIGLGVMGFADLLLRLGIAYNSKEGVASGENLMKFIQKEAHAASEELAVKRGSFPNFKDSVYAKKDVKQLRNATVTTIAPAGTLSMIVDASSGIEPIYALVYTKHVLDGTELLYVNRYFEAELIKRGLNSRELARQVSRSGSIRDFSDIPEEMKKLFVVSADISPEWHIRMQSAFQKYTDNAVSKTINFPANATIEDVKKTYMLAYKLGCKGVTIYRDRSRMSQVLTRLNYAADEEEINDNQIQLPFIENSRQQRGAAKKIEEVKLPPISS